MQVQIDLWELLMSLASLVGVFASLVWMFGTLLVKQFKALLDQRFTVIQGDLGKRAVEDAKVSEQLRKIETDFLNWKAELPVHYVRREDYIRGQTVIESKLDALYSKLEVVQIQGAKK